MPEAGGPISGVGVDDPVTKVSPAKVAPIKPTPIRTTPPEVTTDPPVSEAQRRAMHAAASGKSTLDIPQSVGKEFVESIGEGHDQSDNFLDQLKNFVRGLLAWVGEEQSEQEHATPSQPSTDRQDAAPPAKPLINTELRRANDMAQDNAMIIAFDQGSVRSKDADGRLHVADANISKAVVNPYRGAEIPDYEDLGLDPDETYQLLRDPNELAKAASTFNRIPILSEHVPISAADHPPELVIGATGSNARFEPPYLRNELVFWPQTAIDAIENGEKRELSCAYRYRPDMRPGVFQGQRYDGIMRDIVGNHVAAVPEGRAGHDVMVGDSKPDFLKEEDKVMALRKPLTPAVLARGKNVFTRWMAQDQIDPQDIAQILPQILGAMPEPPEADQGMPGAVPPPVPNAAPPNAAPPNGAALLPSAAVPMGNQDNHMMLQDAIKAVRARDAARRLGRDETDEEKDKREADDQASDEEFTEKEAKDRAVVDPIASAKDNELTGAESGGNAKKPQPDLVTKSAMDAAMKAAEQAGAQRAIRMHREIRDAERAVMPYVGELNHAFDSAGDVYAMALKMRGVETKGIHPSAYQTLLTMLPKAGAIATPRVAMDAAASRSFADRFPEVRHIKHV